MAKKLALPELFQKLLVLFLALSPFLVLFDTLLLPDVEITAVSVWSFFILLHAIEKPTIGKGILLGSVLAIGWWYFSLVYLVVAGLVGAFLLMYPWKKETWKSPLLFASSALGAFLFLTFPYALTQVSHPMAVKRTMEVGELLEFPIVRWITNASTIVQWFLAFVPAPLLLFSIVGIRHDPKRIWRGMAVFCIVPLGITLLVATAFSARNLVIVAPLMILLGVRGLSLVRFQKVFIPLCLGISGLSVLVLIVSPLTYFKALAPLPAARSDFGQYVTSWSSGYGVKEAADWFSALPHPGSFAVVVRNDSGNPEDGMFSYLLPRGIQVLYPDQIDSFDRMFPHLTYYFVSRGPQYGDYAGRLTEITRFTKPLDKEFVGIYRLE